MITEIDASLLEKIADLTGKPVGAFNIRKDSGCEARQSTEHIAIDPQPEGKSGIIIRIKDGTKGEQCHIPVIISKSGVTEMVYNDFYVGENCDVDIVAGCGIHNSGCNESRHDGVHTFYVSKNSHVRYVEKHYGEGDGEGSRVMNPTTIVYLDEGEHPDGDRADPRHRLHRAQNEDRLRQGRRGRHHRAPSHSRQTARRERHGDRAQRRRCARPRHLPLCRAG